MSVDLIAVIRRFGMRTTVLPLAVSAISWSSSVSAEEPPAASPTTRLRLWLEPPIGGFTFGFGDSPVTTSLHFGAVAVAVELSDLFTVEAGAGVLPYVERRIAADADVWVRGGIVPVLYRPNAGAEGWVFQLASTFGYRRMGRSKIVYEDWGVDTETVSCLAFEVGPVWTEASTRGAGFAMRLLTGLLVPVTHTHSWNGFRDYPVSRLTVAIPVGFDIGWVF